MSDKEKEQDNSIVKKEKKVRKKRAIGPTVDVIGEVQYPPLKKLEDKKIPAIRFTLQNVYTIMQNCFSLQNNFVNADFLTHLYTRCEKCYQQFTSKYTTYLPLNSNEHLNYEEKLIKILTLYADKDDNGNPIEGPNNSYNISDELQKNLCDNSLIALKEEYKELLQKFADGDKVMHDVYINYQFSKEEIEYVLENSYEEKSELIINYPDFKETLTKLNSINEHKDAPTDTE